LLRRAIRARAVGRRVGRHRKEHDVAESELADQGRAVLAAIDVAGAGRRLAARARPEQLGRDAPERRRVDGRRLEG